jgi:glycerol-1-phosphate dehydrogenase [NAD(P)+]
MTQPIPSIEDFLSRSSSALADSVLDPCPECGRKHPIPFHTITIERGAVERLPGLARDLVGGTPRRAVLIYDAAIEPVIRAQVIEPLHLAGLMVEPFAMFAEEGHLLDSGAVNGNQAADAIGKTADLLIGAGSGVICDLTKWIATRLGTPFLLCGTAPSMNGYTSITATITENDIKLSKFLNPADGVILDIKILAQAPLPMVHSGMGDLAARAICNADWKLSQLLKGTYFCSLPFRMTAENERRYLDAAEGIGHRDPEAIELLSEAILLSGLSMTVLEGETSPSSGAEHVISHFWDYLVHLRGLPKNFHGAQVGVGTVMMLSAYEVLRELDPRTLDPQKLVRERPTLEAIEAENRALYGENAESFNAVARKKHLADDQYVAYVQGIIEGWDNMWQELEPYVAPVERIRGAFDRAGVPYSLASVRRTREEALEALLHGGHYRPRYTALDFFWELGLFPQAANEILERSGVL